MKVVDLYTDGCSKGNPGVGGFGFVLLYEDSKGIIHRKEMMKGFKLTTNNRMELMSVIYGLKQLKYPCNVNIYSDSKYVVDAFNKNYIESWVKNNFKNSKKDAVKNIDLWKELIEISKIHKTKYIWVKGHDGNVENERCDKLSNLAIKEALCIDNGYIE